MKKAFLLIFLFLLGFSAAEAQEVYNYLLESSTRIVNNPASSFTQTRIAQFKRTALVYMKSKAFEVMPRVTDQFLNTQAYYMSEFVALFFDEVLRDKKLSASRRREKIYLFMDASKSNPLFNDPDAETTDAFMLDSNDLTPFSLDTDWQKAYLAARNILDANAKGN